MAAKEGAKNSSAKLTLRQVKVIWNNLQKGATCADMHRKYPHVRYGTIAKIHRGETWNSVTGLPRHTPTPRELKYEVRGK